MKAFIYIVLFSCLTLFSCKKESVYDKMDKNFKLNRWEKSEIKTYEFSIDNKDQLYDVTLKFAHVYDYQFDSIPLKITIEKPSGGIENIAVSLKIKDAMGKELADCSMDICDLKQTIKEKTKLEKGKYKISISHHFKGPYLPNVLGVGLKVSVTK
jgi:gliding motility-associated lipoprotein GldH